MTVVASKYARVENDLYQTEPWATEAFVRRFPVAGKKIWEPSAGNHLIADVLTEKGADVYTSDIVTYSRGHDAIMDFFDWELPAPDGTWIVTNPPYGKQNRLAVKFAETALSICDGFVALLLTMKFDSGNTRHHLFRDNPRFAAKIVLVDRISFLLNDESGTEDNAWFVWGPKGVQHTPTIFWEGKAA